MTLPIQRATAIPEDAAEPLFFFGTLLDPDVRALVTGVAPETLELRPASLPGFARHRVRGRSYPMLVPAPGRRIEGMICRGAGPLAIRRLNAYEGAEYAAELRVALDHHGQPMPAWVYVAASDGLQPTSEPWELVDWQARHKATFMARGETLIGSELP